MSEQDAVSEIYQVLLAIRNTLDFPYRLSRRPPEKLQALKSALLMIEAVRLDALSVRAPRGGPPHPEALPLLRAGLEGLLNDPNFREVVGDLPFRERPPSRDRLPPEYFGSDYRITDVLLIALTRLDDRSGFDDEVAGNVGALRRIVPEQKLAPVKFDIRRGRLVIVKQPAEPDHEDAQNVQRARDALLERGANIVEALERSNCDRRVVESLKELQKLLAEDDNIIELALLNMGVERVCKGASAELPDAILGALEGHTTSVGMYVAQFPEWRRFSENAASVDLSTSDIAQIDAAAKAVIERLDREPDIAEAEVPATLRALRALIADPARASKRAAFAVLRTVENLVARVYRLGADFMEKTANRTVDGLSKAASAVLIGSLMALALSATSSLGPVTGKVAEAGWMRTAAQIVKKQIDGMVD